MRLVLSSRPVIGAKELFNINDLFHVVLLQPLSRLFRYQCIAVAVKNAPHGKGSQMSSWFLN